MLRFLLCLSLVSAASVWCGEYKDGKKHGRWIEVDSLGVIREGNYVAGKKHGYWTEKDSSGTSGGGEFFQGEKRGGWVEIVAGTWPDYGVVENGKYSNGKREGRWSWRHINVIWMLGGGNYVDGRKDGEWTDYDPSWEYCRGRYVSGKKQGSWRCLSASTGRSGENRRYLDGQRHGLWKIYWLESVRGYYYNYSHYMFSMEDRQCARPG